MLVAGPAQASLPFTLAGKKEFEVIQYAVLMRKSESCSGGQGSWAHRCVAHRQKSRLVGDSERVQTRRLA